MGTCQIIQGDARQLENILCDKIENLTLVTNSSILDNDEDKKKRRQRNHRQGNTSLLRRKEGTTCHQQNPEANVNQHGQEDIKRGTDTNKDNIGTSPDRLSRRTQNICLERQTEDGEAIISSETPFTTRRESSELAGRLEEISRGKLANSTQESVKKGQLPVSDMPSADRPSSPSYPLPDKQGQQPDQPIKSMRSVPRQDNSHNSQSSSQNSLQTLQTPLISAIITSPPFKEQMLDTDWMNKNFPRKHRGKHNPKEQVAENIGNLEYGNIDSIITRKFDNNVNKCYNIDKCLLEFILEVNPITKLSQMVSVKSGLQEDGITNLEIPNLSDTITARIVGVKLIGKDEPKDVNRVREKGEELDSIYLRNIEQAFVNIIKECLASDIQFNQELKCLLPCSKVENLELLLTNAIITRLTGRNGENKFLNEINIPASFVKENLKEGKISILSHITFSQLLNIPNLSLKFPMALPSVKTATTKQRVIKENQNSATYLSEMLAVYKGLYKVLKSGGLMILVVKPFIRDQKIVPLQEHTKQLCQQAGFLFIEQHQRVLPSMSFWRVIYYKKHPEVERVDKEYILCFRKV